MGDRDFLCRVPPFGYLRVNGRLHLSVAFRSLPRPSSASIAKASTVCPYYLYLIVTYGYVFALESSFRMLSPYKLI